MTPWLASLSRYASELEGKPATPPRRRWNRALILTPPGRKELLTVPVCGGIGAVKHADPLTWQTDDSRNWRHVQCGALNAAYGRTPFFRHFFPEILAVIGDTSDTSLASLARRIDMKVKEALAMEDFMRTLRATDDDTRLRLVAKYVTELTDGCNTELSMLHYIAHFGPDAIFFAARNTILRQAAVII